MTRIVQAGFALVVLTACLTEARAHSLGPYVGLRVRDEPTSGSPSLVAAEYQTERRGSGVVVGTSTSGGWFVLTNAHVVEPMIEESRPVPSVYAAGEWRAGRVLGTNRNADLALVLIHCPERMRIMKIADGPPADGASVTTRAFASGTKWTTRKTRLQHSMPLDDGRRARAPHTHFVKAKFQQGESGGAVVSDGRLVGLIYGNDIENGWGLCVDYASITSFLARWGWKPGLYARLDPRPLGR